MVNLRDYASLFPNYQEQGNRIGQIRGNQSLQQGEIWSSLIKALGGVASKGIQDYQTNQMQKQAQDFFAPSEYKVGDVKRPDAVVSTDLVGKPIAPVAIQQQQSSGMINPMQDPRMLMDARSDVSNPFKQKVAEIGIDNMQLQAPKYQELSAGTHNEQINPFNTTAPKTIDVPFKPTQDKRIGQATVGGRLKATMQQPDGKTYQVDLGESFEGTRLGLAKANLELSKKRIDAMKDDKVKNEGKYLLKQWDTAENKYNKNQMYLSDPNLSEGTRQALLEEQAGLAQEMIGYTASIESLGSNVNDVIAQPKPNVPKPKATTPQGGKIKVKRKSDGKTGTIDSKDFNAEKYDKL